MKKVPVTIDEILLRGCTLKNSGRTHGMVVYTGAESRIQMNAAEPPRKVGEAHPPHLKSSSLVISCTQNII